MNFFGYHKDHQVRIVSSDAVLIAVWRVAPTMELMRVLAQAVDQHRDRLRGRKQAFVNVATDGVPNFSEEVRAEAARHARRSAGWRCATAHVVEIGGMRGIAVRSFMSTMLLLGRPRVPTKVFDHFDAAAPWLLPHLDDGTEWSLERLQTLYRLARGAGEAAVASARSA